MIEETLRRHSRLSALGVSTDADLNRRLRAAGRAWVEAHYAWPVVYRQVDEVYARLLDEG